MTSKNLPNLQELAKKAKKIKAKNIFDIVIYGSFMRGKTEPEDIDIAIILSSPEKLRNKLDLSQDIRNKLSLPQKSDIKTIDIKDLLDISFLARQAILAEGYSLIHKKYLHELFGFTLKTRFIYSLNSLSDSQKKMLFYALNGRRGQKGLLDTLNGTRTSPGVIEIPLKHTEEFKQFFKMHGIEYKISHTLSYNI